MYYQRKKAPQFLSRFFFAFYLFFFSLVVKGERTTKQCDNTRRQQQQQMQEYFTDSNQVCQIVSLKKKWMNRKKEQFSPASQTDRHNRNEIYEHFMSKGWGSECKKRWQNKSAKEERPKKMRKKKHFLAATTVWRF